MISEDQKQDLRDRNPVTSVAGQWVSLRRGGARGALVGPCPMHSPDPHAKDSTSFECWEDGWVCATCQDGGDVFKLVMLRESVGFNEAVAILGGEQEVDPAVAEERRRAAAEKKRQQEELERIERAKTLTRCEQMIDRGRRVEGTLVQTYLEGRGLTVDRSWTFDLRFSRAQRYLGYVDEHADDVQHLGDFPAMLAAIRDHDNEIIGIHRTYLDPETGHKLAPPGDRNRNKAKKIVGEQHGGLIRLSAPSAYMAIGEGIETSRSWRELRTVAGRAWGVAAAVSLGNLSGRALTKRDHPTAKMPNGKPMRIPDEPDLDSPGIILPAGTQTVALLGDGDSDPFMTRARLLMGGKRFQQQGVEVVYDLAPIDRDFNDVLMVRRRAS